CDGKADYDGAIAEFREAIRIKKDYAYAHHNLGEALSHKGRLEEAINEYCEAIRLEKHDAKNHYDLGNALNNKGQLKDAVGAYREAIRLDKDWAAPHNALAWLLATCPDHKFRDSGQAVAHAKKAVELAPGNGGFWNTLGVAHYRNGDWKAVIAAL